MLDLIVEHAQRDAPNECCGLVSSRDGEAVGVHPAENLAASPLRFEVDGREVMQAQDAFEAEGAELGAIYHSHTRSEPYPSQTDVNFSGGWPGVEWIIVGLSKTAEPVVRSYLIDAGEVREVELVIG